MEHDDDVCPPVERLSVTSLLVSSVSTILRMHDVGDAKSLCHFHCIVAGRVVHKQQIVDNSHRNLGYRALESLPGVVGGKDDHDPFAVDHRSIICAREKSVGKELLRCRDRLFTAQSNLGREIDEIARTVRVGEHVGQSRTEYPASRVLSVGYKPRFPSCGSQGVVTRYV